MFFEGKITERSAARQHTLPSAKRIADGASANKVPATKRAVLAGAIINIRCLLRRLAPIGLLLCTQAVYSDTDPSLIAPSSAPTVMVLGDSISAAYGIKRDSGWVSLLQQHLLQPGNAVSRQRPVAIVNASISGETTGGALARLPKLLAQHRPNIVIIELGGNDALRGYPIKTLRYNLQQLVALCHRAQATIVVAGMRIPPNYGKHYTQMFYNSFVDVANRNQTALVPFLLDKIAIYPELMQGDGIHPTAAAQQQILDNVLPHLNPLLTAL